MPDSGSSTRLAVYLAGLVTLALLPLGVISIVQTRNLLTESDQLARSAVQARTVAAAIRERSVLHVAAGAGRALGVAHVSRGLDDDACSDMMRDYIEGQDLFVFAAFLSVEGRMTCSSTGDKVDFSDSEDFQELAANPRLTYRVSRSGVVTKRSVVIVSQPIFIEDELQGFVSISSPHQLSLELADPELVEQGVAIALIGRDGEILAANREMDRVPGYMPPQDIKSMVLAQPGQTFSGLSAAGEERIFSVTPLLNDQIAVIGSWPKDFALSSANSVAAGLSLVTPIVMWLAGLAVALWGLHRLVIRHLEALRRALRRFALGERVERLDLDAASQEFRYIQTAFNRMLLLVREGELQQERDLQEKTILLREVHHRVKNNLQLIASIMNMQSRNARTPEARRLLAQLQRRVRGLAMVHHTLNAKSKMTSVDTKVLIERLVAELVQGAPIKGLPVEVSTDVISLELGQDQAVTLSMLVAEALTNAVKYVGVPPGGRPEIRVELNEAAAGGERGEDTLLRLSVWNTRGETDAVDEPSELDAQGGIGQRLMRAFVSQLEAEFEIEETETRYAYNVTFPVEDFSSKTNEPFRDRTVPPEQAAE